MTLAAAEEEKEVVIEFNDGKKIPIITTKQELNAYACLMESVFNNDSLSVLFL